MAARRASSRPASLWSSQWITERGRGAFVRQCASRSIHGGASSVASRASTRERSVHRGQRPNAYGLPVLLQVTQMKTGPSPQHVPHSSSPVSVRPTSVPGSRQSAQIPG
ncbi:hypothetical protein AB0N28_01335 [Streptomyces sp. NPDC051130]|uniref:hypothetical protein n=1 Tax=Streptomyces sp. NPDC051130 TaxID=3157223 RepID=UPI0034285AC8